MTKKYFPPPNWPPAPPGWTPPPGWLPDPKWGPPPRNWMLWREEQSWFSRHKVLAGVGGGGLALLFLVGTIGNAGNTTTTAGAGNPSVSTTSPPPSSAGISSPSSAPTPAAVAPTPAASSSAASQPSPPASEYGNYPSAERDFVAAVEKAQVDASDADNELQYGAALSHRNKALCKIVGSGKTQRWVGKVSTLDSNGDGFGVLAIAIGDTAAVGTWNNALSDYEDNTLIKPGNLLDNLSTLEEGQQVEFSGRFIRQSGTCVNDKRLTKVGKIDDPEFVFKFSSVKEIS